MKIDKAEILQDLANAIVAMEEERVAELSEEAVSMGIDAHDVLMDGLSRGMEIVGRKYANGEYFIPQLLVCSDAMYAGIEVLKPHLKGDGIDTAKTAVIGVVEGDTHDIGKNLVKLMLESSGFRVHDLGRDVPLKQFPNGAEQAGARLICISTLMTTGMDGMEEMIRMLEAEGVRERYRIMVGGGPISQAFADRIGADGYAPDAVSAVKKARQILSNWQLSR